MFKRPFSSRAFGGGVFPLLSRVVVGHPLLVIASWIVLAAVLMLSLPSLAKVAAENPPEFLPAESPVLHATEVMGDAFNEPAAANSVVVILTNDKGLTPADEATYRTLVETLRSDPVVMNTQDFISIPELKEVMTSEDHKAYNLPVNLTGQMATFDGQEAYKQAVEVVNDVTAGTTLTPSVVGAAATFDDVNEIGVRDQLIIETTTGILVFTILVLVYRSFVAMMLPLLTIGAALLVAQQVVAGLGMIGMGVGPQTLLLMTAMMLGAGTDYAIFLLSRYQEIRRSGVESDEAMQQALTSIGQVIAGSAFTVAAAFMGMAFTDLGVFSTVGPPLAVTILIGFLGSVTMLPALMTLAGRRNWLKSRKDLTGRIWRRSGVAIVRRPRVALAGSLAVLLALASCMALIKYNYDDRKNLPDDIDSNLAYEKMNEHFPVSSTAQQFLLIQSPGDLRSPEALAAMEQMAQRISDLDGIDAVRGITRPTGEMIEQGKATWQAGEVGNRLGDAAGLIDENQQNLSALTGGADQLADVLDEIRGSVINAVGSVRGLASALDEMSSKFGGEKTLNEIDRTASLVSNMRSLGKALGFDRVRLGDIGGWASPMIGALNTSPQCSADPECVASRADLQKIADLQGDPALDAIAQLGDVLVSTNGNQTLDETIGGLSRNLTTLTSAARELGLNETNGLQKRIDRTIEGANTLADSSRQLAEGVQLLVDQTRNIGSGLDQASAFLMAMKRDASGPQMSGFYIPPEMLTQEEFKKAASLFISDDGHTARYLVQTELDPFSVEAMDQLQLIVKTAEDARPNTVLEDATISMVGFTVVNDNLRTYYNGDIRFIILVTLAVVFLILALILRAIIAPLYLVASVVLSFVSAVGIGVVFFQFILGQNIHWSVPGTAFLVLVAVGADYNLLLIHRIRDEVRHGHNMGQAVVRTVGATGGVITSAGIIFAVSMLSLTVSSLSTVVQMGFVIGVGLLLDTFIVRTVTVPAMAVLVGNANWWPMKSAGTLHMPAQPLSATKDADTDVLTADDPDTDVLAAGDDPDTDALEVPADPSDTDVSSDTDVLAPVEDSPPHEPVAETEALESQGDEPEVAEVEADAADAEHAEHAEHAVDDTADVEGQPEVEPEQDAVDESGDVDAESVVVDGGDAAGDAGLVPDEADAVETEQDAVDESDAPDGSEADPELGADESGDGDAESAVVDGGDTAGDAGLVPDEADAVETEQDVVGEADAVVGSEVDTELGADESGDVDAESAVVDGGDTAGDAGLVSDEADAVDTVQDAVDEAEAVDGSEVNPELGADESGDGDPEGAVVDGGDAAGDAGLVSDEADAVDAQPEADESEDVDPESSGADTDPEADETPASEAAAEHPLESQSDRKRRWFRFRRRS